ncbi:MAG TPA: 50S ribosomal protein L10 [Nitrososphaeraceae archaeon]|nr:50S ribosomal protein L10 [Nitrososphaeraceae archaeon]
MRTDVTISRRQKNYPKKKRIMYQNLQDLVKSYNVIALSKITKVRATQLMTIRKKFRNDIKILVIKNKVAQRAFEKVTNVQGLGKMINGLEDQCALMFTNISPFKLNLVLNKNKVFLSAKGGDIAAKDVTIPAGNTGITPGPVLSEFKEANVPTKIEQGSIWVSRDTVIAKSGTIISQKLASLMSKLNIKPIEAGISVHSAIAENMFFSKSDLKVDLEEYRDKLLNHFLSAVNISIEVGYTTTETVKPLIARAQSNSMALVAQLEYLSDDTTGLVLAAAQGRAQIIANMAAKKGYVMQ